MADAALVDEHHVESIGKRGEYDEGDSCCRHMCPFARITEKSDSSQADGYRDNGPQ